VAEGQHAQGLLALGADQGIPACKALLDKVILIQEGVAPVFRGGEELEEETGGRLEVYALGEGRVVRDGQPVSASQWQGAITKELFFYILFHGPMERDQIGLVFWPDLPPKKMTDSFHTTLYRVRRAVGGDAIVVEDGQYQLGHVDCWLDVEEFESAVERARLLPPHEWQAEHLWRRAVRLYQGDLLPEVDRTWCIPKREALREMYIEALIGMARCYEARGECGEAVAWYKRALTVDELRESIHRLIMECYARAGRRSEALAHYETCREILQRELAIEPSPETQRLYEQIAGRRPG
jgi:DNA-binding SARP family transcriptional activator